MAVVTRLKVNGQAREVRVDPEKSLLSVLREDLELTGPKYGCGEGQCGACTVLIDGVATRSCITPLAGVEGKSVTTIEGLQQNGHLHPVQQAFLEEDALQCAYCTPGMIMEAVGLLRKNPHPSEQEVIRGMQGNLCRCGAYRRIVAAIRRAASQGGQKA